MKTHMRDIRLRNNGGMDYPVCQANAKLLDLTKAHWPLTGDLTKVTCENCKRSYPLQYPWAHVKLGEVT
jgi:hypothetical protein